MTFKGFNIDILQISQIESNFNLSIDLYCRTPGHFIKPLFLRFRNSGSPFCNITTNRNAALRSWLTITYCSSFGNCLVTPYTLLTSLSAI